MGDTVLIRQKKQNKLNPAYNSDPMTVIGVEESMISASSPSIGDKTRNSSPFKWLTDRNYSAPNLAAPKENDDSLVEGEIDMSFDVMPRESQNAAIATARLLRHNELLHAPLLSNGNLGLKSTNECAELECGRLTLCVVGVQLLACACNRK